MPLNPTPRAASQRWRIRSLWVPVFMMAGISLLSGTPGPQIRGLSFAGVDKIGHLVVFGLLAVAWARSIRRDSMGSRSRLVLAVVLATGFGLLDELHQFHNPVRYFEWADLAADFAGALAFAALYLHVPWLQVLLETDIRKVGRLQEGHPLAFLNGRWLSKAR